MKGKTRSGEFRYPITVQRLKASASQDAFGQTDQWDDSSWETYITRRACKETQPGTEPIVGEQVQPVAGHILTVRADAETKAITTLMRVIFNGKTLHILSAENVGYRLQDVVLICKQ